MKLSEGKYVETIVTAYVEEGREESLEVLCCGKKPGMGFYV